jgi:hypothetical protein
MYIRASKIGLFLITFLLLAKPAAAQPGLTAGIYPPDTGEFPRIETFLDIRDALGQVIPGLTAGSLRILEDGQSLEAEALEQLRPGAQFVLAINPGPSFAIRNSQGLSRSDILTQALTGWLNSRRGTTIDDLSLLIQSGIEISHLSNPTDLLSFLSLEQVNLRQAIPTIDSLSRAIDIASDPSPRPGMGRAVLLITPPVEAQSEISTDTLVALAQEQGVRVHVLMVPDPGAYTPNAEQHLRNIAAQTGGTFSIYSDDEPMLDPESILEPLRSMYRLVYSSAARSSGTHQLAVEVETPQGNVATSPQTFDLNILPPDPAFVSPPLEIERKPPVEPEASNRDEIPLSDYLPEQQEIQVLVGFPDERMRRLVQTSFFVDGQLVAENRQEPFDRFTWKLDDYTASGAHTLRVEAEDELGMVGSSIDHLVQLTVELPPRSPWLWVYRNIPALSALAVILAGSVLLLILVLGGRLGPRLPGRRLRGRRRSDPVTQPVQIKHEPGTGRLSGWANRIHWPQRPIAPKADAFLNRLSEEEDAAPAPIPILSNEITLGSDPNLATLVIDDPSVESLHARLYRKEDGTYRIVDEGSIAGTWINYSPISPAKLSSGEGTLLEHGDLVHIGRVGFRFSLSQPAPARKLIVKPIKPNQERQA